MSGVVLVTCPLKKTEPVDVRSPIERFITNTYGVFDESCRSSLNEFASMREAAVLRAPDRHESGLEPLYKYYDQLAAMEGKLPISDSQVRIKFTWYDAFSKESFFSGGTKESMHSNVFERLCLLFNVAALQSQIAKGQNFDSDEGLKTAVKHFQGAAGVFYQVKEMVYVQFSKVPLPDMTAEMLGALAATMLAQAQESLYYKTTLARMKNQICAKVAAQAGDLYSEAARLVRDPTVSKKLEKEFVAVVSAKHPYFHGLADYHEGLACKENAKFGEAIARFRLAYGGMSEATKRGEQFFKPGDVFSRIQRDLAQTEKDNNVIYSDLIPEPSKIAPVGRAALAKPAPLTLPASTHQDLFAKVVPLTVHNAIATYESNKDALIQAEVGKLREASQMLNGVLSSLNLPAAIEDVSGNEVPPSLLEKAAAVRKNGGVTTVKKMFDDLPELQQRNKEILDETIRTMDDEERADSGLKDRFKEKWTRQPSSVLFRELRAEANKYMTILTNATQADGIVKSKYDMHVNGMTLLSKSQDEVIAAIPKGGPSAAGSSSQATVQLRALMEKVNTLRATRDSIETSLKDTTADISARFLTALDADGGLAEQSISEAQLNETYGPLQAQVQQNLAEQEQLVGEIQAAHGRFVSERGGGASARDSVLKDLAAAHDSFMELKSNLGEGTKFYNDLTQLLVKFQTKVGDLIFARNTEKEDLTRELQKSLSKADTQLPPAAPTYQSTTTPSPQPSQPPPRPAPRSKPGTTMPQPAPRSPQPPQATGPPPVQPQPQPYAASQPQPHPHVPPPQNPSYGHSGHPQPYQPYSGPPAYGAPPYPTYQTPPGGYQQPYGYGQPPQGYTHYPPQGQYPGYPPQGGYPPPGGYPPHGGYQQH